MIKDVYDFLKKEAQSVEKTACCDEEFVIPIQRCQERTRAACGVSRMMVQKILQEGKNVGEDGITEYSLG